MVPDAGVPATEVGIFINGWGNNGTSIWGNYNNPNPTHQISIADNFTWIKGHHSLKFGYEYEHIWMAVEDNNPLYGSFTFSGGYSRCTLANDPG